MGRCPSTLHMCTYLTDTGSFLATSVLSIQMRNLLERR